MIERRTVLILGTGSSIPFGFPSGRALKELICHGLSKDVNQPFQLLRQCGYRSELITGFRDALLKSGRSSVDAFLEYRPDLLEVGKTAIAAALIPFEVEDRLFEGERNWYEYLFGLMIRSPADIPHAQEHLSVITFNYDRSLEHFLGTALQNSFSLHADQAREHVNGFRIVHVYGQLGELRPGPGARPYVPAEPEEAAAVASQTAKAIKIVHEGAENPPELSMARDLISKAQVVTFLGFGYLPENVARLGLARSGPHVETRAKLWGSAHGLTQAERRAIQERVWGDIYLGPDNDEPTRQDVLGFLRENRILI